MKSDTAITSELNHAPIYLRVAAALRHRITAGEIGAGDTLPSERDLADSMAASRVTIRKAIEQLIAEGLLLRKRGSGTFVAPRIEAPGSFLSGFSEDAAARGATSSVRWLQRAVTSASTDEAAILELGDSALIVRLARVRLADGQPLAIEHAIVPAVFLPDITALGDSLYDSLAALGNRPASGTQRVRASLATAAEADLLSIPAGSEVLRIERLTRLADGRPVELTRSAYRGDRYDFVSELRGAFALS